MRKARILAGIFIGVLLATVCLPTAAAGYALPENTALHAEAAILVNLGSSPERDVVLFEKNADEVHAPAAMMRYMVVAYALKCIRETGMDIDTATGMYTRDMFNNYVAGTGVPTANMAFGETWTVRDLLGVSFLQNASDALTALAFAVDGGVTQFVAGMNELAEEIGCDYTHFSNLTGLDSLGQYTTARDVVRIIRYAQQFSEFEGLVSQRQITVTPVAGGQSRTLTTINHMLQSGSPHRYTPLVYSRTGLSEHEGRTCASVARDSGYEYLTVVLGCPEQNEAGETGLHYRDTRTLFRWAFNNFTHRTVLAESEILASVKVDLSWNTDHVNLIPQTAFSTVVEDKLQTDQIIKKITLLHDRIDAPVEKGTVLGQVDLIVNVDQTIGSVPLVAADSISRSWFLYVWSNIAAFFTSLWCWLGVGLLCLLAIGYAILNVLHNRRRRRDRLQRVKPHR